VGDLAELLKRANAGIVTQCDAYDIVRNLVRVFENRLLQRDYEARAREVAEKFLAWPTITNKLENFYQTLLCS
jgi:glycosyltransferase involved in cell wall biosynthesis